MCSSFFLWENSNFFVDIQVEMCGLLSFLIIGQLFIGICFLEVLMNNYKSLKKQLKFCIKTMNDFSSLFVVDSNKDFTRKRKHLFGSTLFNVLLLESGSLKDEMFKLFGYKLDTPTASSFVQARSKIRPDAFRTLFNMFNERTGTEYKVEADKGQVVVCNKKVNNAIIENRNKIIKCIKNNANGYTNWSRFRNRVMYVLDPNTTFSLEPREK